MKTKTSCFLATLAAILAITTNAFTAQNHISITSDEWTTVGTWGSSDGAASVLSTVPSSDDNVYVRGAKTVTLSAGETGHSAILQVANIVGSGTLNVYGTLSSTLETGTTVNSVGLLGTGTMNVYTGGSYSIGNHIFTIGAQTGNGVLNIEGGSVTMGGSGRELRVAINGTSTGTINIRNGGELKNNSGGATTTSGAITVGNVSTGSIGQVNVYNGTLSANRIQVYNGSSLTFGSNATLSLRSTAISSPSNADRALTLGGGTTLKFQLGATKDFNAINLTGVSFFMSSTTAVVIDVTAFAQSFATLDDFDITLLNLDTTGLTKFDATNPTITLTGLTGHGYLDSNTKGEWIRDVSDNITGLKLVVSPSQIPEPSTYAAILGALALGALTLRRRSKS